MLFGFSTDNDFTLGDSRTPITPSPLRSTFGMTSRSMGEPFRSRTMCTCAPLLFLMAVDTSVVAVSEFPKRSLSTLRMMSPSCRPYFAPAPFTSVMAGITTPGLRTTLLMPLVDTVPKSAIQARIMLKTTPPLMTRARCSAGRFWMRSGSSSLYWISSSSSLSPAPAPSSSPFFSSVYTSGKETYPPNGKALNEYSIPSLSLKASNLGPNPIQKSFTLIPCNLAARKWPASWNATTPHNTAAPENFVTVPDTAFRAGVTARARSIAALTSKGFFLICERVVDSPPTLHFGIAKLGGPPRKDVLLDLKDDGRTWVG
mmetsp:Transcript_71732/g.149759  ORF Transcript_71732/g.149759 Transcript_71732/m.149759 type:complete len:315 (-) Transcript_71732:191-1135(-)